MHHGKHFSDFLVSAPELFGSVIGERSRTIKPEQLNKKREDYAGKLKVFRAMFSVIFRNISGKITVK